MKETKHLIYWWLVWFKRLVLTSYHIINRRAYHKWKENKSKFNNSACRELFPDLDAIEESDFF